MVAGSEFLVACRESLVASHARGLLAVSKAYFKGLTFYVPNLILSIKYIKSLTFEP